MKRVVAAMVFLVMCMSIISLAQAEGDKVRGDEGQGSVEQGEQGQGQVSQPQTGR